MVEVEANMQGSMPLSLTTVNVNGLYMTECERWNEIIIG